MWWCLVILLWVLRLRWPIFRFFAELACLCLLQHAQLDVLLGFCIFCFVLPNQNEITLFWHIWFWVVTKTLFGGRFKIIIMANFLFFLLLNRLVLSHNILPLNISCAQEVILWDISPLLDTICCPINLAVCPIIFEIKVITSLVMSAWSSTSQFKKSFRLNWAVCSRSKIARHNGTVS